MDIYNSHISQLFGQVKNIGVNSILTLSQNAIGNISKINQTSKKNFTELEEYLNYIYYGKKLSDSSKVIAEQVANNYANLMAKNFDNIIKQYNPDENDAKIARNAYGLSAIEGDKSVSIKTYEGMLKQISTKLSIVDDIEKYEQIVKQLRSLKEKLENLLSQCQEGSLKVTSVGTLNQNYKQNAEAVTLIKDINVLWDAVSYDAQLPPMSVVGQSFESGLQQGGKEIINNISGITVDNLISFPTSGTDRTSIVPDFQSGLIQYSVSERYVKEKEKFTIKREYIIGENNGRRGGVIRVNAGAFDGIQQKMDIEFQLPSIDENNRDIFKISAKNWASMSGNLGKTTLLNAFLRTGPLDTALAYGLGMSWDKTEAHTIEHLQKYAKYIAALDIVAGVGQKNGYADTLVIQDRQQQQIHVYSISDLLNQFQLKGRAEHFAISNEDKLFIHPLVSTFRWNERLEGYTYIYKKQTRKVNQFYMAKILGALKSKNISISYRKK